MPRISIITTTYKHARFIADTIESVLSQTFTDWELLIGDDNSPDETYEIAAEYATKDARIRVWKNISNLGIVGNMNALLSRVSPESEYIAFLEGDDMFTPNNLEEKMKIFIKFPEVKMVYNNLDFIDWNGKIFYKDFFSQKKVKVYKNKMISQKEYMQARVGSIFSWSTAMIRKDILWKIKIFNPTKDNINYAVSDEDFYFTLCQNYPVYWIDDSLTLYRRHTWNLSGNRIKLFNDLEQLILYYLDKNLIEKEIWYYRLSWIFLLKSIIYIYQGSKTDGLKSLIKAIQLDPWSNLDYKVLTILLTITPHFIIKKFFNKFLIK